MKQAMSRNFDVGLLFCLPQLENLYRRMGWTKIESNVYMTNLKNEKVSISAKNITMFYPLKIQDFPAGDIDLAGLDW